MGIVIKTIKKSLNKGYLKHNIHKPKFEEFKNGISTLLRKLDDKETEEHNKNIISEFLKNTNFKDYDVNTKDKIDLVIRDKNKSDINIIFETKSLKNKGEFPTKENINVKAFHELILYYLKEKTEENNSNIKNLIITNGVDWFIFDVL